MSQRVTQDQIEAFYAYLKAMMGSEKPFTYLEKNLFLDLRDARLEIARLKTLSESQAHALNEMEAGRL